MTIEPITPLRILLVEDNPHDVVAFQRALKKSTITCEITYETGAEDALHRLQTQADNFDIVVTDNKLPGMSGLELCLTLRRQSSGLPLLLLTGTGSENIAVQALKAGINDYLVKDIQGGYLDLLPVVLPQVVRQHHDHLARRRAEAALQQHALELQARNEELDAFAHTVAHDLQSLVIGLANAAEILVADYATMPGDQLKKYSQVLARSAHQANNIIQELLILATVRKETVQTTPLDMVQIVGKAQQRLADMIAEYQAELSLPPTWPAALGHVQWVEEVWVNYLSNGLKYGGQPPRLQLGATPQADETVRFWVRDNGPGLTAEAQSHLFIPFTRLNQTRAQGHGLGLSIVQRIIEKLGGQVGVESDGLPGNGSTFYFTLPAAPAKGAT
ncbi:MAG: hybrid sensor histidine kinase/response regulator [Anaerolineae bacterium]